MNLDLKHLEALREIVIKSGLKVAKVFIVWLSKLCIFYLLIQCIEHTCAEIPPGYVMMKCAKPFKIL